MLTTIEWSVYDVANRESFDALPRWFSELETYVKSEVVKIIVGNKVDKVSPFVGFINPNPAFYLSSPRTAT